MDTHENHNHKPISKQAHCCHDDHDDDGHDHDTMDADDSGWKTHWPLLSGLAILLAMLVLEYGFQYIPSFPFDLIIFIGAYLLSGYNVLYLAWRKALRFDFFNEFF